MRSGTEMPHSSCSCSEVHFKLSDRTLSVTVRDRGGITAPKPSPDPSCPALHQTFFCRLAAQSDPFWVGLESGGCEGSKKWALSHWIMPLFQLLWPGMPNFTARYSSLCVNQSFARGRGAHWVRLQPACDLIQPLIPQKPDHTCSFCMFSPKLGATFKNDFGSNVFLFEVFFPQQFKTRRSELRVRCLSVAFIIYI